MFKRSLFLLLTALAFAGLAQAQPCFDQALPLLNVGVTVYPDCQEADVVYFVPQNLKIDEHFLSGEKSFSWKPIPAAKLPRSC